MPRMSPARARGTRRSQLQRDLDTAARCARAQNEDAPDLNDWFRHDGERSFDWSLRRGDLLAYCRGCPVIAQCRELALRYDDRGDNLNADGRLAAYDDHVRGGLTAAQLATTRRRQRTSIDRAITADQSSGPALRKNHSALATLRTAPRDAYGWGTAA